MPPSRKIGFKTNISTRTEKNTKFRQILFTTKQLQLVVMSLKPGQEIGSEVHRGITQFIRVEKGRCVAKLGTGKKGTTYRLKSGDCVIIPAGTRHNIINTGPKSAKLYTLYSPPAH